MRLSEKCHTLVVDLGYGDAGKGTVVDWLCAHRPVNSVVRFNGGAQAGHNVVAPDGRHHTFSQFGSGTLHGVPTFLSRFMLVDPLALAAEATHLAALGVADPFGLVTVDPQALLVTPWHTAANRARELRRGADRHGSCGMGVGETASFALAHPALAPHAGDTLAPARLRRLLGALRAHYLDEFPELDAPTVDEVLEPFLAFSSSIAFSARLDLLLRRGSCVFEGAQGVLLDEWFGWHPYTTWSTTTFDNALELLGAQADDAFRLGVVRTYTTRHGPGPLVTEDFTLTLPEPHNGHGRWQGAFRRGHFDAVAHRYAVEVCGRVDGLAVTHADALSADLRMCVSYADRARIVPGERGELSYQEKLTSELLAAEPVYASADAAPVPEAVSAQLGVPVAVISSGPTWVDKDPRTV